MGRSLGSGPAVHVASLRNPANLILLSPFTSIGDITRRYVGKLISWVLAKNRFVNIKKIGQVECPILFLHGMKDSLIPPSHSDILCRAARLSRLPIVELRENMTHNYFEVEDDVA